MIHLNRGPKWGDHLQQERSSPYVTIQRQIFVSFCHAFVRGGRYLTASDSCPRSENQRKELAGNCVYGKRSEYFKQSAREVRMTGDFGALITEMIF